jgi:uncharacterized protein YciI
VELHRYHLVMLRRRADSPPFTEAELDELQRQHLAYLFQLQDRGVLALNGPVLDGVYPDLRGLSFYATETPEEAAALAAADPMVRAGRLRADVMGFLTRPGHLTSPGVSVSVDVD